MTAGSNNRQNMQRAYRRLLKSLTATGAYLEATGTGEVALEWVLRGAKSRSPVSSALVRHALSTGALERQDPGGTARRLGITDDGRKALRRLLCTGDAAQSQHRELAERVLKDDPASPVEHLTVNLRESPIAWLASRRDSKGRPLLDIALVKAGERLRADYTFAALVPSVAKGWQTERTSSGGASTGGRELTDDVLSARERVAMVLGRLEPTLAGVAVDVCCHLKGLKTVEAERGWPARSAKVVLQIALSSLADEYGVRTTAPARTGRSRVWTRSGSKSI